MSKPKRLNLGAIEASLREVQRNFSAINATLSTPRDPLTDEVLGRLLLGYRYVDQLLRDRVDLFALGNSRHLIELNMLVLCGEDAETRTECGHLIDATEAHFYGTADGGVASLIAWNSTQNGESIWSRAAGTYIHILSRPQLFIEGNHRTGALVMSWLLARNGKPPFVLSVDNAKAYFDPSTLTKNARKHSFKMLFERPRLVKRFAVLLKQEAESRHFRGNVNFR
jgi:prophage maintenance system killer protein